MLKNNLKARKIKSLKNPAKNIALINEQMTKFKFVMLVIQGTTAILVFTLIFTLYAFIIFLGNYKKINIAIVPGQFGSDAKQIAYLNDKNFYRTDEMIKLNIVNGASESIYLAPCQYFNKFEKKIADDWQSISLFECDNNDITADTVSIEKISKLVEDYVSAKRLGEGVWRGVSKIYFGCRKAQTVSCVKDQMIYTSEFTIGQPELASSNSQL